MPKKNLRISKEFFQNYHRLTDSRDDGCGEEEASGKLPLLTRLIGFQANRILGQIYIVLIRYVVLVLEIFVRCVIFNFLFRFVVRLEEIKDGGADEQIGEHADHERKGSNVLLLHCQ